VAGKWKVTIMDISDEFFAFYSGLHQDADIFYGPDPEDWVYGALGFVASDRLPAFRDYLNELFASGISDQQLQEMMRHTHADYSFHGGARDFFERTRDAIDAHLRPGAPDRIALSIQAQRKRLDDMEKG
jgi:hypothetical protein